MDGFTTGAAADIGPQIEAMLSRGEQVVLLISGNSMRPTLKPGRDAVIIEPVSVWPPKRGDILFYRSERGESGYSVHRVYRVKPQGPIMNGDAQEWVEGPLEREAVLGAVVGLLRAGDLLDTEKLSYRAYVFFWRFTRPIRWPLFALWRKIKGVKS